MVCRRFGVRVHLAGVEFHYFIFPLFRARQRDSLFLMSHRGRLTFGSVGFWAVLAVGSFAVIMWKLAEHSHGLQTLCLLAMPPTLIRLVVQLNPFNTTSAAYLALCEWTHDFQLLDQAEKEFRYWWTLQKSPRPLPAVRRSWYRHFGFAYLIYKVFVAVLLVAGLVLLLNALSRDKVPVWTVEFALILLAVWGSRNRT